MIDNIYNTTLELIKEETKYLFHEKSAAFYMMERLVKIMGEHDWNELVQSCLDWTVKENKKFKIKKENEFGNFFSSFHKQFRQIDTYDFEVSKDLGRLDEDEAKYWTNYAKKNGFSLRAQTMGKGEFERKVYTLHLHHLTGHLDMLFYELIHASQKVELIMEYIWEMHTKKYKNFEEYSWSDDFFDFKRSRKKERLTENE